jgi:response regulator RpfG family c-di-GMP phosphodiesterase
MSETMTVEPGCILLVDHSRGALLFQETILRRRKTIIITALAGSEGLQKAKEEKPKLVVERETPEHVDLCMSAGCNDHIFRPIQRRELDAKVAKLTSIPVRRQLRTITKIEVSLEKNGRFVLGRSLNISANGMLIEVDRVLPADGRVRIHFYLPGDPKPLQLEADILRAEFAGTMAKYGLKFMSAVDEERERIEQYVHRLRSRELI